MTTWAVLATGASMSQQTADAVKGKCHVVAVSDAYKLAPWADALVSSDLAWWKANPEARNCDGRKFIGFSIDVPAGVERFSGAISGSNSGLLGVQVAVSLGARKVLLCGFDMGGTHYFGPHLPPLKNTKPDRFREFKKQFLRYKPRGVEIINCTPGSQLTCYPRGDLAGGLHGANP